MVSWNANWINSNEKADMFVWVVNYLETISAKILFAIKYNRIHQLSVLGGKIFFLIYHKLCFDEGLRDIWWTTLEKLIAETTNVLNKTFSLNWAISLMDDANYFNRKGLLRDRTWMMLRDIRSDQPCYLCNLYHLKSGYCFHFFLLLIDRLILY